MEKEYRITRYFWLIPGIFTLLLILYVVLVSFFSLFTYSENNDWYVFFQENNIFFLMKSSFFQATLSTFICIILAIPLSKAFFYSHIVLQRLLVKLCSIILALPVIVIIFGILSVYGKNGWISQFFHLINIDYNIPLYGHYGVTMAHVFFNLPLATIFLFQVLKNIPLEHHYLAEQLKIKAWNYFYLLEWPVLKKKIISFISLIFILCFTSFTIVLMLGGPKNTNIELIIFQLLTYDFNLQGAFLLSLIQMVFCLGIVTLASYFNIEGPLASNTSIINLKTYQYIKNYSLFNNILIFLLLIFLLPPIFSVIIEGCNKEILSILFRSDFWKSILTSIRIAIFSSLFSVILSFMLIWTIRELKFRQYLKTYKIFELSSIVLLTIPSKIVTTGLFLFFNNTIGILESVEYIVIIINAIITIPYIIKILENPFFDIFKRYNNLCSSLKIKGWYRIQLIELRILKTPLTQAFAFSCVMSIGDLGVVSLFGNQNFCTLPLYFYQQINAHNNEASAAIALLLLVISFILFFLIEKLFFLKNA